METIYQGLRQHALELKPEDVGVVLSNSEQVYAAVADMQVRGRIVSLYCAFDGTVSLYYSDGQMQLGLGETESIRKAAMGLLISAGQCLKTMKQVKTCPAETRHIQIYLLAKDGIYCQQITGTPRDSRESQFLNFLIQQTLTAIREEKKGNTSNKE